MRRRNQWRKSKQKKQQPQRAAKRIAKDLYEHGVYVNSSLPPAAAPHECLLRTSLMATHTHALIDEAVDIIAEVLGRYDL